MHNNNTTIYPYLSIYDPKLGESVYMGYDIDQFFNHYEKEYFLECDLNMWLNCGHVVLLGKLKDFKTFKRVDNWQIEKADNQ